MENLKYIVAIAVPTKDGKHTVGTGCSVSNGLVLTARHVVFPDNLDPDRNIVVYFGVVNGAKLEDCTKVELNPDCVEWKDEKEEKKLDAVLLRCPRPEDWKGASVGWAPTTASREWNSRGYPRSASTGSDPLVVAGFNGELDPMIRNDHFAQSTVSGPPKNWHGASGMPLLCKSGAILGLAYEMPQGFQNGHKINVVPTWKLFENDAFKAIIQKDDAAYREFRNDMQEWIANILQNPGSEAVAKALAKKFGVSIGDKWPASTSTINTIAGKVVNSSFDDLLQHLVDIQEGERGRPGLTGEADLKAITEIMHVALPALDDPHGLSEAREAAREVLSSGKASVVGSIVPLRVATRSLTEISMALADRLPASFVRIPPDEPDPPGRFALEPLPVPGRNQNGQQVELDLIEAMENLLEERFITGSARNRLLMDGREESKKDRVEHINIRLKNDKKKRRHYYAVILPTDETQRTAVLDALEKLKFSFPSIVFLALLAGNYDKYNNQIGRVAKVAQLCQYLQEDTPP